MGRGRKSKGRSVSGWLVLDKPYGMGSTEAVTKVRRMFGAAKAGHAGTLDPLASGMLPIALGEATKTVPYVTDGSKAYRFKVAWGAETTTDDLEGTVTKTSDVQPDVDQISNALPKFVGAMEQVPPQFSAVKINGERAYDVARGGREAAIKPRIVEIDSLDLIERDDASATFECVCGKGTYVRAIARDLGRMLGCFGHVTELRRLEVFPFAESDFVSFDHLQTLAEEARTERLKALQTLDLPGDTSDDDPALPIGVHLPSLYKQLDATLLPLRDALEGLQELKLNGEDARRVRLGNAIVVPGHHDATDQDHVFVTDRGSLIAIGDIQGGAFQPRRVFVS